MSVDELLAREEIRVLLASYNMAGDRGRLADLAATFAPDGALMGRERLLGRAAIEEGLGRRRTGAAEGPDRQMEFVRHNLTTSLVTFENETAARGRTYFIVFTNIGPDHMGVYVDSFEKRDGRWLIAEREVRIDWVSDQGHTLATRAQSRA